MRTTQRIGVALLAVGVVLAFGALTTSASSVESNPTVAVRGVSPDATSDNGQQKLARATDGTLYLAYAAPVDGVEQAHIAFSVDEGQTWKPEITLGQPGIWSDLPAIATGPGGRLDATWVDYVSVGHVWHATKQDGSWSEPAKISPGPDYAGFPAIVVTDDTAHVVWYAAQPSSTTEHGSEYEIEHTFNEDGTWSTPDLLSASSDDALNPSLTGTADGNLEASWYQIQNDVYRAEVATFADGAWTTPSLVSVPEGAATGVSIVADTSGRSHLVWEQSFDDGTGVAYASRIDGEWSTATRLSTGVSSDPVVAVDADGRTVVIWSQEGQIAARIGDGGWSDPTTLGQGTNPTVLSGDRVLAAWTRQSEAGDELVTTHLEIDTSGGTTGTIFAVLGLVAVVSGLVLVRRDRQPVAETPEIERTDRTSGK